MKPLFLGIVAAITMTIGTSAPSHAMNISSATRSIATAMPVEAARFSERAKFSRQLFCLQMGNDCRTGGKNVVAYTNKLRTVPASVNRTVNLAVPAIRAQRELLSFSPLPGPSEDYVMLKRSQLIKAGVPASSMRIANVTRPYGRRHSVLVVATTNGDFVLDNRQQAIVKRNNSGYSFVSLAEMHFSD
ncbi:transglutaminase-like cysteine peptidase [Rhizobium sp. 32-5/1]|uniref:transglutaminase-like cysteine peptidase n=1 Tax=Rhizobium sp. 32-5/1 TaxID=3019602 RepID=UPI00240E10E9|nr:transglutaminase-like cysteine peptidase [Rhizobium sp. 32-5/1]WEZ84506.1 transglutaminase-like cysteine peptidase [Rhizobium sp. 32-5/1]